MAETSQSTSTETSSGMVVLVRWFDQIDRRVIYVLVAFSLAIPLVTNFVLPPARMETASAFFNEVNKLEAAPGKIVLIASDWGPGTQAENKPQTAVAMEHLMRKRIPFALISITPLATPFLKDVPRQIAKKLEKEKPGETWRYGTDWVNFGYQPGATIMIQGLAKSEDFHEQLKTDVNGTPLSDIECMKGVRTIQNILMLMEFTGLVGAFNYWIQYFQSEEYRPPMVHGCTSITIPEAYIYYSSKQIVGFHEGLAGAAWYDKLLSQQYPDRKPGSALRINTGLAVAHLVVIALIILGNLGLFIQRKESR